MDSFDRHILTLLQDNCRLTNEQIAEQVNLSATSVRRRIARLREDGIIIADVSLVDPGKLGITVIVSVTMNEETRQTYSRFKKRMLDADEVTQCYTVSGETDFIVIAHFRDLPTYEVWIDEYILSDDTIRRSDTNIVYSRFKYATALPVTD
ncbi:Lrp/AsnC family transcriptional regulator [Parvularcula flava]|uniref:AsnC family transcriptional regulator n=1 Tax=Aquisalinus luteolus TaxID=1566827 RepID=A0A8J3A370_9PROT|nr:Lrp/AsnC family transcriptional regulator [Aquisalinus luteolus]NHK28829.1 Lrp/AsnC family transcriptional regulator [Aquisalinus luteolus]GGH99642.1 AsnC family transcriptional regulator [Aquisalinus luteolus]